MLKKDRIKSSEVKVSVKEHSVSGQHSKKLVNKKVNCVENKKLKWDKRFMEIAKCVSSWSTCVREGRQVGAVIVRDKRIIATGYNGAPSGVMSCAEKGYCLRDRLQIPSGTRHEVCYATHAEQNALVQAAKLGISVDGATMYITHQPCSICTKLMINAGVKRIVYGYSYPDEFSLNLLEEAGIEIEALPYDE